MTPRTENTRTELPEGETKREMVESMFDTIAPTYDRLNRVISLGLDRGWRRKTVAALALDRGACVIDLACGTGDLCEDLATVGIPTVRVRRFGRDARGAQHDRAARARATCWYSPSPMVPSTA